MAQAFQKPAADTPLGFFCAIFNCAGWVLSAFHRLPTPPVYHPSRPFFAIAVVFRLVHPEKIFAAYPIRESHRMPAPAPRRAFPTRFLPSSPATLDSRAACPPSLRELHALALSHSRPHAELAHWPGHWHWVHTDFPALTPVVGGIEWVSTPLIALGRARTVFPVINQRRLISPLAPFWFTASLTRSRQSRVPWHGDVAHPLRFRATSCKLAAIKPRYVRRG